MLSDKVFKNQWKGGIRFLKTEKSHKMCHFLYTSDYFCFACLVFAWALWLSPKNMLIGGLPTLNCPMV